MLSKDQLGLWGIFMGGTKVERCARAALEPFAADLRALLALHVSLRLELARARRALICGLILPLLLRFRRRFILLLGCDVARCRRPRKTPSLNLIVLELRPPRGLLQVLGDQRRELRCFLAGVSLRDARGGFSRPLHESLAAPWEQRGPLEGASDGGL